MDQYLHWDGNHNLQLNAEYTILWHIGIGSFAQGKQHLNKGSTTLGRHYLDAVIPNGPCKDFMPRLTIGLILIRTKGQTHNNNNCKTRNIFLVMLYTRGCSESFRTTYSKLGIQVHFRGNNTIHTLLVVPKGKDDATQKSITGGIHCGIRKALWGQAKVKS